MRNRKEIDIKDMSNSHLENTINMLKRRLALEKRMHETFLEMSDYDMLKEHEISTLIGKIESYINIMEMELEFRFYA